MVEPWPFVMVGIAILIVLIGIVAIWAARINAKERVKFPGKYPEGHFLGKGMGVFMGVGIAIGIGLDNLAIGVAIGIAIGVAVGQQWEAKAKKEGKMRPMTKKEKEVKRKTMLLSIGLLVLGVLTFIGLFFLK